jgi:hypothetical protein
MLLYTRAGQAGAMPESLAAATYSLLDSLPPGVLPAVLVVLGTLCAWGMYVVGRPEPRPPRPLLPRVEEEGQLVGSSVSSVASGRQQNRNGV